MRHRAPWFLLVIALLIALSAAPVVAQDADTASPEPSSGAEAPATAYDPFAVIPIEVEPDDGPLEKAARDPLGNGIAILVLVLLLVSLIAAPLLAMRGSLPAPPTWWVPVLVVAGMAVAAYLATVETSGTDAICGPVGDCNAVQQSEHSSLLGIHIGVLGLAGYALLGMLWVLGRVARGPVADAATVLLALGTVLGVAFSAYLTFLEPFVIGATCMWCIASALLMVTLLWASARRGWDAWVCLRDRAG